MQWGLATSKTIRASSRISQTTRCYKLLLIHGLSFMYALYAWVIRCLDRHHSFGVPSVVEAPQVYHKHACSMQAHTHMMSHILVADLGCATVLSLQSYLFMRRFGPMQSCLVDWRLRAGS